MTDNPIEITPERERIARAISIPQHHTSWDTLSDAEKDLFYMQADYALEAMHSTRTTSDEVERSLDMAIELIQEAKGAEGPNGGFVTNHLDAAESELEIVRRSLPATNGTDELKRALSAIHACRLHDGKDEGYGWNITALNKAMNAALPLINQPQPPDPFPNGKPDALLSNERQS